MRMYDMIDKKKQGKILSSEEIDNMIKNYMSGEIPDYQMSAMLMAIYFQGMNDRELADLTLAMAHSGEMVDLSEIPGVKVDKHSTGGVGDKTTLIIAPIVAACGGKVAKMSGRGLGFTGGTVDKLESIAGYRTDLTREEFFAIVKRIGISVIGQSKDLAPADKKMYALRDVTATVNSIPLIAASIMSKKLAAGSDCILLDVTTGSGAFMKEFQDALFLSQKMVEIGERAGRRCMALITNMNTPLGFAIGNNIEVIEAVEVLNGNGPEDLIEVCLHLATNMLYLSDKGTIQECKDMASQSLKNGSAFHKFVEMIEAQGGDSTYVKDTKVFKKASFQREVLAVQDGYITGMNAEQCGIASGILGAGRVNQDSVIDYAAGILIKKKTGDKVRKADVLAVVFTSEEKKIEPAMQIIQEAYTIGEVEPEKERLLLAQIDRNGITKYSE